MSYTPSSSVRPVGEGGKPGAGVEPVQRGAPQPPRRRSRTLAYVTAAAILVMAAAYCLKPQIANTSMNFLRQYWPARASQQTKGDIRELYGNNIPADIQLILQRNDIYNPTKQEMIYEEQQLKLLREAGTLGANGVNDPKRQELSDDVNRTLRDMRKP